MKNYIWTTLKARLRLVKTEGGKPYNWLFLPGGPGMGSESLHELTKGLQLPGSMWHLDLPGDGSNLTSDNGEYFSHWSAALVEAVQVFDNVILVAHSTGGMYALATPELEHLLTGLVLMDSAPNASWQKTFSQYVTHHPIAEMELLQKKFTENPSNETLKKVTIASAPYVFTEQGLEKGISILEKLPINYETCEWSAQHFDSTYKAKWFPKNLPTLIFAGEHDHITPLNLFAKSDDFTGDNILIREIKEGGHFPWIENFQQINKVFTEYCQILK